MNSRNEYLHQAYKATTYRVPELDLTIRIGQGNQQLNELLLTHKVDTWAFITAWNPESRLLSQDENSSRNRLLSADLEEYISFIGLGIPETDDWQPEESFLVLGITKENALELCHKYNQNAFVFGSIDIKPVLIVTKS